MAIVLDINVLCKKVLNFNLIKDLINDYEAVVDSINSIDTWEWDNEQQINFWQIEDVVNKGKIIIVKLVSPKFKDLGIYIEKMNDVYLYTLWINTEGYPELDSDTISVKNRIYYEKVYREILKINKSNQSLIKIVGIGLETEFSYDENVIGIVQSSRNMSVWIVEDYINLETELINYRKNMAKEFGVIIYERDIN